MVCPDDSVSLHSGPTHEFGIISVSSSMIFIEPWQSRESVKDVSLGANQNIFSAS